ncbi:MAG: hypothetical protein FJ135_00325 [Deltaproteobacteria bacterium]|nr:hypothetical protein [Deltaproteobacteria bacterium]
MSTLNVIVLSIYDDAGYHRLAPYARFPEVILNDMRIPENKLENRAGEIRKGRFSPYIDLLRPCLRPFDMVVVRPNGMVSLCCGDMYCDVIMGDVARQRLEDIWHSPRFQYYRSKLLSTGRRGLKLCQVCSHNGSSCGERFPFSLHDTWMPRRLRDFLKRRLPQHVQDFIRPQRWVPMGLQNIFQRHLLKRKILQTLD